MTCKKCPFFNRKVSSYRYKGIKCNGVVIGNIALWSEEKRDLFMAEKCYGDYESNCGQYQSLIDNKI